MELKRSCLLQASAVLLLFTIATKFVSLVQMKPILYTLDSVTGLSFLWLTIAASLLEILVLAILLGGASPATKGTALFVPAAIFASYKAIGTIFQVQKPCPCLGAIGDWLALPQSAVQAITGGILVVWVITVAKLWLVALRKSRIQPLALQ